MSGHSFILDIETLSTIPHSVVFDVAVLAVERESMEIADTLGVSINITEQLVAGRVSDEDTIRFHQERGGIPLYGAGMPVAEAIQKIWAFFDQWKPVHVWIQGPDFDRPVLEDLFRQYGFSMPWKYSSTRDCRTAWALAFPGQKKPLPKHDALGDCFDTLDHLRSSLKHLSCQNCF